MVGQSLQQAAVTALLHLFSPGPIYAAMAPLARTVSRTLTPSLLIVSVYLRIVEAQVESFSGAARWIDALRDMVLWSLVLSVYFTAGGWVAAYMNSVYALTERMGSVGVVSTELGRGMAIASAALAKLNTPERLVMDAVGLPVRVISMLIYYVTLALLVFVAALMGIMHAIGYSLAFIYGLIAIPVSVSGRLRLIRGWALLYGFVLLWPVVQALIIALFRPVFSQAVGALVGAPATLLWSASEIYFLFAVLNLLVAAILLIAPALAYGLVSNVAPASLSLASTKALSAPLQGAWSLAEPAPGWYRDFAGSGDGPSDPWEDA